MGIAAIRAVRSRGAVAATVVIQRLHAAAHGDVERGSAFTLVGADGTVLARLRPGATGDGNLTLYDTAGTRRLVMVGSGVVVAYEQDGTTPAFRAGRSFEVGAAGNPPVNGVELGPDGSISMIPPSP